MASDIINEYIKILSRERPAGAKLGAGLSGFAAPFLGQTWTPPSNNISVSGIDPISLALLSTMAEKGDGTTGAGTDVPVPTPVPSGGNITTGTMPSSPEQAFMRFRNGNTPAPLTYDNNFETYDPLQAKLLGKPVLTPRGELNKRYKEKEQDLYFKQLGSQMDAWGKSLEERFTKAEKSGTAFNSTYNSSLLMAQGMRNALMQHKELLKDKFGIDLNPTRGMQGMAFAKTLAMADALGYNDFMASIADGLTTELAIEIGKSMGQGAGMRIGAMMVDVLSRTLPKLKDKPLASNIEQLVVSMTNGFKRDMVSEIDPSGKKLFTSQKEMEKAMNEFEGLARDKIYNLFVESGLYTPKDTTLKSPDGKKVKVPDYMRPYFLNKGYKK